MKYLFKIFAVFALSFMAISCVNEDMELGGNKYEENSEYGVFGDKIKFRMNFMSPDQIMVKTRSVDPDGKDLRDLALFCFDENGIFITTVKCDMRGNADVDGVVSEGSFDAMIPSNTRIFHILGNQNMTRFDADAFEMKSEDEVLSILEGSSGMLIYWARVEIPENVMELYPEVQDAATRNVADAIFDWLSIKTNPVEKLHKGVPGENKPIYLLRNQAKFTIVSDGWDDMVTDAQGNEVQYSNDPWKGPMFEVTGFAVCNTPAFGTVAPYHKEKGYPTWQSSDYDVYTGWVNDAPITSPLRAEKMSDITDVTTSKEDYVFETDNKSTDPVDLILRGRNRDENGNLEQERYYYRVNILDPDGEFISILRNHHYVIHIAGNLTNGCKTFEEALVAPPTNNIWLSISDEVNAVMDNEFELAVEKTKVIVSADSDIDLGMPAPIILNFSVKDLNMEDSKQLDHKKLTIHWVEDDQIVSNTYNPSLNVGGNHVMFAINGNIGHGMISLNMNNLPEDVTSAKGTLLVKYGRLQRTIRIVLVKRFSFVPSWVSAEVYGNLVGENLKGENVAVIFTIPQTCPAEMFPFDVLFTTNGLDGRASSGQILPIITQDDKRYGEKFSFDVIDSYDEDGQPVRKNIKHVGYKYKYTVTAPGQHRLYFKNIFNMQPGSREYVVLEANHFDMVAKPITYVAHQNKIILPKLLKYSAIEGAPEAEMISYMLVPQKRFAQVIFDIGLQVEDGTSLGTLTKEEFLLYSSNLDHYPDDDTRIPDVKLDSYQNYTFVKEDFDCYFKPYNSSYWSTGGRIFGFYPREGKVGNFLDDNNCFQVFMETNKPNSAEIVRVASNQIGSVQVKDNSAEYNGRTFRSVTFELANYRPFRFAAQVNDEGNYVADDATSGTQNPEVIDNIEFTYLPDEVVKVAFDVTSFLAADGTSVDPFGTAFEIFIDAPMLRLEKGMNKNLDGKNFEDIMVEMFDKTPEGVHTNEMKPKLEDLGNGRFVYRVNALNYEEYYHWSEAPLILDNYYNFPMYGERKVFYFKKNSIVSKGEITISANPDHVTYHSKTFRVSNTPITGIIGYQPEDENGNKLDPQRLPAEHFVSFTRVLDGSRIGVLAVKEDPHGGANTTYELKLRGEYDFNWENDPIEITAQVDGVLYSYTLNDLSTLYENRTILLSKVVGNN